MYKARSEVMDCIAAERSISGLSQESIGGLHSIDLRDELMEDYMYFNGEVTESRDSLREMARGSPITTTKMRIAVEEMTTPEERVSYIKSYYREIDKRTIKSWTDNTAGGHEESQSAWAKRMGLKAPRNRDQRGQVDWSYWVQRAEKPSPSEIAWIFGHLYDPDLRMNDENLPEHPLTEQSVDIFDMSWPEQRTFRWNNPEGFKAWVKALKEEMGPWFDESLVIPEYRLPDIPKKEHIIYLEDFNGTFEFLEGAMQPWKLTPWGEY